VNITFSNCLILLSALWRVCSLVANEEGPFGVFDRLRRICLRLTRKNKFFGALHLYQGLVCEWCNSIWFAVPLVLAWILLGDVVVLVVLPLAFSAWVIVLKYAVHLLQNAEGYYHELKQREAEAVAMDPAHLRAYEPTGAEYIGGVDFGLGDKSEIVIFKRTKKGIENVRE
jgi:hypothetical protein